METKIYSQTGKETGSITLPEEIFGLTWNADLVHQVAHSMKTNMRTPVAHTKTRGEVRGGGKKPWQQKGTGRARHGSTRSPIWVGGGVAHGPRNDKNFDRKVNKKMKSKALFTILSQKLRDGEVMFVDAINFATPKAKEAKAVILNLGKIKGFEKISTKKTNTAYVAVSTKDDSIKRGFSNFKNIELDEVRNLNPLTALQYKYIVIANPTEAIKIFSGKASGKANLNTTKVISKTSTKKATTKK
ncbi:MAG: 50S ribosomal protein L4 [Candidatus Pacebacteria bacterium]|nr:50S ribosomal protein L4 [Candidatus Paceibacterota bacterium]